MDCHTWADDRLPRDGEIEMKNQVQVNRRRFAGTLTLRLAVGIHVVRKRAIIAEGCAATWRYPYRGPSPSQQTPLHPREAYLNMQAFKRCRPRLLQTTRLPSPSLKQRRSFSGNNFEIETFFSLVFIYYILSPT